MVWIFFLVILGKLAYKLYKNYYKLGSCILLMHFDLLDKY